MNVFFVDLVQIFWRWVVRLGNFFRSWFVILRILGVWVFSFSQRGRLKFAFYIQYLFREVCVDCLVFRYKLFLVVVIVYYSYENRNFFFCFVFFWDVVLGVGVVRDFGFRFFIMYRLWRWVKVKVVKRGAGILSFVVLKEARDFNQFLLEGCEVGVRVLDQVVFS